MPTTHTISAKPGRKGPGYTQNVLTKVTDRQKAHLEAMAQYHECMVRDIVRDYIEAGLRADRHILERTQ